MRSLRHGGMVSRREHGYSLIELMVAILIALFLIAGVITIEQSVRNSYSDRNGVAQLENDERFTMTMLSEITQSAGYYPDPAVTSQVAALPAATITAPNGAGLSFTSGQAIDGVPNTTIINGTTYDDDSGNLTVTINPSAATTVTSSGDNNLASGISAALGNPKLCELGSGTVPCTAADMAGYQLVQWELAMANVLNTATTDIVCAPVNNGIAEISACTITVSWTENTVNANREEDNNTAFQNQSYQLVVDP